MARNNKRTATEPATPTQPSRKVPRTPREIVEEFGSLDGGLNKKDQKLLNNARNKLKRLEEAEAEAAVPVAVDQPSEPFYGLSPTQQDQAFLMGGEQSPNPHGTRPPWDVCTDGSLDVTDEVALEVLMQDAADNGLVEVTQHAADNGIVEVTLPAAEEEALTAMEVDTLDEPDAAAEPDAEEEPDADTTLPLQDGDVAVVAPHSSPSNNQDVVYSSTLSQRATKYEEEQDPQVGDELQSSAHALLLLAQSPDETDPVRFGATMALMQLWVTPQAALACSPVFSDILQRIKSTLVEDAKRMQHDGVPCTDPRKVFTTTVPKPMDMARGMLQALSLDAALLTKEASAVLKPFISMIQTSVRLTLVDLPDCSIAPPEISGRLECDAAGALNKSVLNDTAFGHILDMLRVALYKLPQVCFDRKEYDLQCAANKLCASATPDVTRPSCPTNLFLQPYSTTADDLEKVQEFRQVMIDALLKATADLVTDKNFCAWLPERILGDDMQAKLATIRDGGFAIPYEAEMVDGKPGPAISSKQAKVMLAQERKACEGLCIDDLLIRALGNVEIISRFDRWGIAPCRLGNALLKLSEQDRPGYAVFKAQRNQRKKGGTVPTTDNSAEQDSDNEPNGRKRSTKMKTKPTQSAELTDKQQHIGSTFDTTDNELAQGPESETSNFRLGDDVSR